MFPDKNWRFGEKPSNAVESKERVVKCQSILLITSYDSLKSSPRELQFPYWELFLYPQKIVKKSKVLCLSATGASLWWSIGNEVLELDLAFTNFCYVVGVAMSIWLLRRGEV